MNTDDRYGFWLFALAIMPTVLTSGCADPCKKVTCVHGTCINGICDCNPGWDGAACQHQAVPKKMTVTSVTVTEFPALNNGASWDQFSPAPDIYFTIRQGSDLLPNQPLTYYNDADASQDYNWSPLSIEISSPVNQHRVDLWDFDGNGFPNDDWMGGVVFDPYWDGNGFPATLNLSAGGVGLVLSVTYTH